MQQDLPVPYCYFIEKGPSQCRAARVPILYANLVPRAKLILIIRNPAYHVMSATVAFGPRHNQETPTERKRMVIQRIAATRGFMNLTAMCRMINTRWGELEADGVRGAERWWKMKRYYKEFLVVYFRRRLVGKPGTSDIGRPRKTILVSFTFPEFLVAVFAYDEVLGNMVPVPGRDLVEITSYRVVQFEWLYEDVGRSMKVIKCWMMDLDEAECDEHLPDDDNMRWFKHGAGAGSGGGGGEKLNHIRNASLIHGYYKWYDDRIKELYGPCIESMKQIVLYDRPELLLG